MNPFMFIYDAWIFLVFNPQTNAIQYFFDLTKDTGWAILIVSTLVNLLLWPLMGKNYLNMQKMRYLQPKMKAIQDQYKDQPAELMVKLREFYKLHKIDNSVLLKMLVFQIFFVSGLFYVIRAIGEGAGPNNLYQNFFGTTQSHIDHLAFGFIDTTASATVYPFLITINFIFTFALGWYTFKMTPKIPTVIDSNETEEKKMQRESMEKSSEFAGIWLSPFLILAFGFFVPAGVGIYLALIGVLALIRQVLITTYYRSHVREMIEGSLGDDPAIPPQELKAVEELAEDMIEVEGVEVDRVAEFKNINSPKSQFKPKKKKK
jgi:YidC/Oxa1 family membrane protein insertase